MSVLTNWQHDPAKDYRVAAGFPNDRRRRTHLTASRAAYLHVLANKIVEDLIDFAPLGDIRDSIDKARLFLDAIEEYARGSRKPYQIRRHQAATKPYPTGKETDHGILGE